MASYPVGVEPRLQSQGPPGGYGEHAMARNMQGGGGLDALRGQDSVTIKQSCTCCPCWTFNSKYEVLSGNGDPIFRILEDTSCPMRCFCGVLRSFEINVIDQHASEVMHFRRPIRCGQCYGCYGNYFFPCCLQEMEVCAPPSNVIGNIRQNFSLCTPSFTGLDAIGQEKFHVSGDFCRFNCFTDLEFKVLAEDKATKIGQITKQWTSCCNECYTNAHKFKVDFPKNTDVHDKALVLASAILVDYLHFT